MDNEISTGRNLLKSNWRKLEGIQSDQNRGVDPPEMQKAIPADAAVIDLVEPAAFPAWGKSVVQAIADRESRRKYRGEPLSLVELSYLLWATQGVHRVTPHYSRRTSPSAGARHSIETYVHVDRVTDVDSGLYRYLALQHKLCQISKNPDLGSDLELALFNQRWHAALTFVWTSVPYRMEWRYSKVSHKLIALDAGHICQNLYIACEAINCGACAIGAYDQELMDKFVGVDGVNELTVYAAHVGKV